MRRTLYQLTDSNTLLGNAVLFALLVLAVFSWFGGCNADTSGLGFPSRVPVEVDGPATVRAPDAWSDAWIDLVPDAGQPDTRLVQPPDTAPALPDGPPPPALGTPYPACAPDVVIEESQPGSCRYSPGKCRTVDGWVCIVCQTSTPCAVVTNTMSVLTEGPRCENRVRVCMSSCPLMNGDRCLEKRGP